ncbi:hypothetical protein ACM0A9_23165 [Mycobacteroides abscessus subsp. abscessus]|uniref:hypothetical protein n=1 Tax=Mycobacteroides abscessus TaxID=36809 RepID=UPI0039F0ADDC
MVFPLPFDTNEDDACPDCLAMVELWVSDRPAFDARIREREDHRREKANQRSEAEQAEADYEEFLRRQDSDLGIRQLPPMDRPAEDDGVAL